MEPTGYFILRKIMKAITVCAAVAVVGVFGTAEATLVDRGAGLVYDTTLNITWLADVNYAATSGYAATNAGGAGSSRVDSSGHMGWDAAKLWANSLEYGGYSDWRLASLNPSDTSCSDSFDPGSGFPVQYWAYDCIGGELSHLFVYDMGIRFSGFLPDTPPAAEREANIRLFRNLASDQFFWSDIEYAPNREFAWGFIDSLGDQSFFPKSDVHFAMAVRVGDVGVALPEPGSAALMLLALCGIGIVRPKRCS